MLARAPGLTDMLTAKNDPYGPADGVTHTLKEHGLSNGLLNVMIEVRNDLIANRPTTAAPSRTCCVRLVSDSIAAVRGQGAGTAGSSPTAWRPVLWPIKVIMSSASS
jgi:predicted N-formylglutamate amidohydrolase